MFIVDGFQDNNLEENAHKLDEIFDFGNFLFALEHLLHVLFHQLRLLIIRDVVEYGHLGTGRHHDFEAVRHLLIVPCKVLGVHVVSLGHRTLLLLFLLALDRDFDLPHGQPLTRLLPVLILVIN